MSRENQMGIDALLSELEADLDQDDPGLTARWLALLTVPEGLMRWGKVVRGAQRLRARDALCRLAYQADSWYDAQTSLCLLEAAAQCCSLESAQWSRAASLLAHCRVTGTFADRVYIWTLQDGPAEVRSRLSYLENGRMKNGDSER